MKCLFLGLILVLIGGACDGRNQVPEMRRQETATADHLPVVWIRPIPGEVDATPTPHPSPVPDVSEPTAPAEADESGGTLEPSSAPIAVQGVTPGTEIQAAFLAGYQFGGGDPAWEEHLIDVIQCESKWQLDPPGIHRGLAQFAPGTWEQAKCSPDSDYRDAWEQGCAVARWMAMIAPNYGTTQGWPWCWWR